MLIVRAAVFAVLWWALTEGASGSWAVGVPAVVLATAASAALLPIQRVAWLELLRFVPFFLLRSLVGGIDVARRTLQPSMPIAPALVDYPLRLPAGLPQVIMVNVVSLLPGTLSADLCGDRVRLHVLDGGADYVTEMRAVERHVAQLFQIRLSPDRRE